MNLTFLKQLKEQCSVVFENEPMNRHTTFKIGGPADLFVVPNDLEELILGINLCMENHIPYLIMGNGSNLLVSDAGIEGVIFQITNAFSKIEIKGNIMTAGAGILMSALAKAALEEGLTGIEFASGIPGTLGGGIYMNAGAYDGEMKNVVERVTYLDENAVIKSAEKEELAFGKRKSMFTDRHCIILSCELRLEYGEKASIFAKMTEFKEKRNDKQPLNLPSAGSVFKRPEGYFAGTLIEKAGLKGFSIGGAQVSEKHAGFIVNRGDATAKDVTDLIQHIKKMVEERFSVRLEEEVKLIGR